MTATWMTTTLSAPRAGGGGLIPAGVNNFKITDARIEVNKYNGRNEAVLRFSGEEGGGQSTIPLEPWDQNKVDTFLNIFNNSLGNIGIEVEGKTAQQVLGTLEKDLPGVIGNIVELNVIHEDQKPKPDGSHLKQDGTPFKNQKVYINRLVKQGEGAPAAGGAGGFSPVGTAGFATDEDIPF